MPWLLRLGRAALILPLETLSTFPRVCDAMRCERWKVLSLSYHAMTEGESKQLQTMTKIDKPHPWPALLSSPHASHLVLRLVALFHMTQLQLLRKAGEPMKRWSTERPVGGGKMGRAPLRIPRESQYHITSHSASRLRNREGMHACMYCVLSLHSSGRTLLDDLAADAPLSGGEGKDVRHLRTVLNVDSCGIWPYLQRVTASLCPRAIGDSGWPPRGLSRLRNPFRHA